MSRNIRCAVYTRKSSEDGLEQEFNSLHAQREACEAYVLSQKAEGWVALPTQYDDGGLSGGTLERPALQQLLRDLDAGWVDQIVVYKIDRLSRSLADFAKIVDRLDTVEASFVSVTQSFNTATSMGRLTLNMLLSFAQFEREVTAERIRDKIAASKRKGLWMGGSLPLGYEPDGRSLKVLEPEASTVRMLFDWYLDLGTLSAVQAKADAAGIVSRTRSHADGSVSGGNSIDRGHMQYLLSNPTYAGKIRHKKKIFDGQHEAIIAPDIWDAVQAKLADNAARERGQSNKATPSPLIGKIFDETGDRLTPSHTRKDGKRLRYYISSRLVKGNRKTHPNAWRLPAAELERCIGKAVSDHLMRPAMLVELLAAVDASDVPKLNDALNRTVKSFAPTRTDIWSTLIERVDIKPGALSIQLNADSIAEQIEQQVKNLDPSALKIEATFQLRRKGVETKLILGVEAPEHDLTLIKNIAKALDYFEHLKSGESIQQIADRAQTSTRRIQMLLPLAFLDPRLIRRVIDGTQSASMTTDRLVKGGVPQNWADQHTAWT